MHRPPLGPSRGGIATKVTFSVIKADIGSIGGHTRPSEATVAALRERLGAACAGPRKLLIELRRGHRDREEGDEWRRQGFVGPTMAAEAELSYTGIVDTLETLGKEFVLR